ncbi:MAG: hypothetical protein ACMUJM_09510 [bacterium]
MSEIDSKTKNELNTRKEILNKHLAKFNQLKNECKWSEAWNQLLITLNYANDTLKYSANLLKNISQKMPQLNQEQQQKIANLTKQTMRQSTKTQKKMIVIPKKQNIH